ncbi:MAG TPA: ATP-binding protein, partial [Pyrinomonadaceae bacterium]|nr:ATP-binding protein [Pyrinomonadaceae bacterium]
MSTRGPRKGGRDDVLEKGEVSFSIESRVIRELGERLVKQPDVALLELIKNAYDADATTCTVTYNYPKTILVEDSGHGMTQAEFLNGWMRIGTSSKEAKPTSPKFGRIISGEKGIGRFAVRYLGRKLDLSSVAFDAARGFNTQLEASFDWPRFDRTVDLGTVKVPYTIRRAGESEAIGTTLTIHALRPTTKDIDLRSVQTGSMGMVSPFRMLLRHADEVDDLPESPKDPIQDPGFQLILKSPAYEAEAINLAEAILGKYVFRCVVGLDNGRLKIRLYRRNQKKPHIRINDRYDNSVGKLYADIRFLPSRSGTFTDLPVDGRRARTWAKDHSGVAVFDRNFRVSPYGKPGDDWLSLSGDVAKRERDPKSSLARRHFPMNEETYKSTQLNYMLRLSYPDNLVGAVQVYGVRSEEQGDSDHGLIAAADREGFVANEAYDQLVDIVRGAAELIAYADREIQQEEEEEEEREIT